MRNTIISGLIAAVSLLLLAVFYPAFVKSPSKVHESLHERREPLEAGAPKPIASTPNLSVTRLTDSPPTPQPPSADVAREAARRQRLARFANHIEQIYGKAVLGLNWSDSDKSRLIDFLVDRYEARYIAVAVVQELPDGTQADMRRLAEMAVADVDSEILAAFGPEKFAEVTELLSLSPYLNTIAEHIEPALTRIGAPLRPAQVVPLASVLTSVYGPKNDPKSVPSRDRVNPVTNLTKFDEVVLERSSALLDPVQLFALRTALSSRNQGYISHN